MIVFLFSLTVMMVYYRSQTGKYIALLFYLLVTIWYATRFSDGASSCPPLDVVTIYFLVWQYVYLTCALAAARVAMVFAEAPSRSLFPDFSNAGILPARIRVPLCSKLALVRFDISVGNNRHVSPILQYTVSSWCIRYSTICM